MQASLHDQRHAVRSTPRSTQPCRPYPVNPTLTPLYLNLALPNPATPPTLSSVRHVMVIIHSTTSSGFNSSWLNSAGGGKHGFD